MKNLIKKSLVVAGALLVMLTGISCSDINEDTSPIELILVQQQDILVLDLNDPQCGAEGLGQLNVTSLIKRSDVTDSRFLDVRLEQMRISYRRNDGGTVVPATFVQSISGFLAGGGTADLSDFFVFESGAFSRAPFVALLPSNGGRDPETGRNTVGLDVVIEVFGETLSGEDVAGSTRFPLTICRGCGCFPPTT